MHSLTKHMKAGCRHDMWMSRLLIILCGQTSKCVLSGMQSEAFDLRKFPKVDEETSVLLARVVPIHRDLNRHAESLLVDGGAHIMPICGTSLATSKLLSSPVW
jgi:hypothetical protein